MLVSVQIGNIYFSGISCGEFYFGRERGASFCEGMAKKLAPPPPRKNLTIVPTSLYYHVPRVFFIFMHIHSSLWTSFRCCVMDIHLSAPETSMLTKTIGTNNSSGLSNHSNGDLSFFSLGKMAGSVLRCQHFLAIIYTMLAAKLSVQRNSAPLSIVL